MDVEVHRHDAPAVPEVVARRALATQEQALGASLTVGQREAVMAITTSGRGAELVVGVAGSGKTTALAAVRDAFEAEGFEVIGTSTSGQAARTLMRQAGIDQSRALASLPWRLDHGHFYPTATSSCSIHVDTWIMRTSSARRSIGADQGGSRRGVVGIIRCVR